VLFRSVLTICCTLFSRQLQLHLKLQYATLTARPQQTVTPSSGVVTCTVLHSNFTIPHTLYGHLLALVNLTILKLQLTIFVLNVYSILTFTITVIIDVKRINTCCVCSVCKLLCLVFIIAVHRGNKVILPVLPLTLNSYNVTAPEKVSFLELI